MNRRVLLLLLLIIIIGGAAAAFFFLQEDDVTPPAEGTESAQVQRGNDDEATPFPTATPIPLVEVVFAVQDIPRGTRIQPNMVQVLPFQEDFTPLSAISDTDEVIGEIARTNIYREEMILSSKIVPDLTALDSTGSDAAAVTPPNRVAVSVPVDRLTSVGYAIRPGDRVDIIVSMLFVDVDQDFQTLLPNIRRLVSVTPSEDNPDVVTVDFSGQTSRGEADSFDILVGDGNRIQSTIIFEPSESQQRPRLTSQTTIQDALVIWVGTFPADGDLFSRATPTPMPTDVPEDGELAETDEEATPEPGPPRPDIVTLAVPPQDAVALTWMVEAGLPITFALRSASSTSLQNTDAVTLDYLLNRFNINVPTRTTYTVEPAIRSIRSIDVGNRIELYDNIQEQPPEEGGDTSGENEDDN